MLVKCNEYYDKINGKHHFQYALSLPVRIRILSWVCLQEHVVSRRITMIGQTDSTPRP